VTGRKGLFVNPTYTTHIVGLLPDESDLILGFLYRHMIKEQFTWRHSWQVGDLAIWDNRSTMHRVIPDFAEHRLMHRVSIVGRPE
jgi:taurine dioxygenase